MKKTRLEREKAILPKMIEIYCHGEHKSKKGTLCSECQQLKDYALARLEHCKFGNDKTFCSQCRIHCYKKDMREKIRRVMRYSGPRVMLYHPIAGTMHVFSTVSGIIKQKRENKHE